jgi:hypothetical protein
MGMKDRPCDDYEECKRLLGSPYEEECAQCAIDFEKAQLHNKAEPKTDRIGLANELANRLGIKDSETTLLIEHYLDCAYKRGIRDEGNKSR